MDPQVPHDAAEIAGLVMMALTGVSSGAAGRCASVQNGFSPGVGAAGGTSVRPRPRSISMTRLPRRLVGSTLSSWLFPGSAPGCPMAP